MLNEQTLFENIKKVEEAILRLKTFEPHDGYYLAFSGGKDSCVIKSLANMAGVKYDAHYNYVGIDPPELTKFIKQYHTDVIWDKPKEKFFPALIRKGFPLRQSRWCCDLLKEGGDCKNRRVITGVRWDESARRASRRMVEQCFKHKKKTYLNVIIDWSESDVWEFIKKYNIPYCKLYDEGWKRIGCLFCPMSSHRKIELKLYPKFENAFRINFRKLHKKRISENNPSAQRWNNGDEMFDWWINEKQKTISSDQKVMFE